MHLKKVFLLSRSCVQLCQPCDSPERLSQLRGELQCELPNRNLYEFNGNIKLDEENQFTPLNAGCLLLRGNLDYADLMELFF